MPPPHLEPFSYICWKTENLHAQKNLPVQTCATTALEHSHWTWRKAVLKTAQERSYPAQVSGGASSISKTKVQTDAQTGLGVDCGDAGKHHAGPS